MSATVSFSVPSPHGPRTVTRRVRARGHRRTAAAAARHRPPPAGLGPGRPHPGRRARRDRRRPARLRRVARAARRTHPRPADGGAPRSARCARRWSIDRPHVAGNSLGGLLALELGREKLVRSVTALSPAGFWSPAERRYAFGVLLAMRQAARRMPRAGGRAALPVGGRARGADEHHLRPPRPPFTRGGRRRDPRAGPRPGVHRDPRAGRLRPVHRRRPRASRSPSPGAPGTGCWCAARGSGPSTSFRGPGWCGCPAAGTSR